MLEEHLMLLDRGRLELPRLGVEKKFLDRIVDRRRLVLDQADLAARGPGVYELRRSVPRRLIEGPSDRFAAQRALYIDRALAPAIALGAVMTVRPMAPIN